MLENYTIYKSVLKNYDFKDGKMNNFDEKSKIFIELHWIWFGSDWIRVCYALMFMLMCYALVLSFSVDQFSCWQRV